MKLKIMNTAGKSGKDLDLPTQFNEPLRRDLIKRAVFTIQNNTRQPYGAFEEAGNRHSADLSKRRRKYRGSYGHGISRVPRKILSRRGTQMNWVGAIVSGTIGGRRAHAPKAIKKWDSKLNVKENRKAIRSAMSATILKQLVQERGHKIPEAYPFIINNDFETLSKTKELRTALQSLGFEKELERASENKTRAGKGKLRGRRKITKKSLLIVVSDAKKIRRAANNIPGIEVVNVKRLNAEILAPGGDVGRATLYTEGAIEQLKTGLFTQDYKGEKPKLETVKKKPKKVARNKAAKKAGKKTPKTKKKLTPKTESKNSESASKTQKKEVKEE